MDDCIFIEKPKEIYLIKEKYTLIQHEKIEKINYRTKKARIHLNNPFHLYKNEFNCIIYYKDDEHVQVKITRLDEISGWNEELQIQFEETKEIINIGANDTYLFEKEFELKNTRVNRYEDSKKKIPKIIIQTGYKLYRDENRAWLTNQSFIDWNPGYKYIFYDDDDCINFYRKHMPENLIYYQKLRPKAYRADFFRYCFLYIFGGCYFDHKMICRKSIDSLIGNEELYLCSDWEYNFEGDHCVNRLYNAMIMTIPGHLFFKNLIDKCIYNIKNELYLDSVFAITGPTLMGEVYKEMGLSKENIKFKHIVYEPWIFQNMLIIHESNQLFLNKTINFIPNPHTSEYHNMWFSKTVYLKT